MVETGSVFCCGTNCPKHNSAAVSEATAFLSLQLDSLQGSYRIKAEPGGIISKDDCDDGAGILRLPSAEITKIINEILTSRLGEACRRLEQEANKSLQEIPPFARIRFKGN